MNRAMQGIGGRIDVCLGVANGAVCEVGIRSTRPKNAAGIFIGLPVEDALRLSGSVFSLCAKAQTIAALGAVENACDLTISPAQTAARDVLRLAEMLTQTMIRTCLGWPRLLGLVRDTDLVRQCLAAEAMLERHVMGGPEWKATGGVSLTPDRDAALALAQGLLNNIAGRLDAGGMAEAMLNRLRGLGLRSFGALAPGGAPEQGALMRNWGTAPVSAAREKDGAGLAMRLAAGIIDMQSLAHELDRAVRTVDADTPAPVALSDGVGQSDVETARGMLRHQVQVQSGHFKSYQIDAPTEANFRPDGPVVQGLLGADASDITALARAAELHIMAIDPCVEFRVEIEHA